MKELSIEERAKAYDSLREKIAIRFGSNVAKEIFSEFDESDDERIRKDLIIYLRSILSNKKYGDKFIEDWITWLEKQGKTFPILSNVSRTTKNWKEPVSEDLEEAAKRYATEGDEISGLYIIDEEVDAFKAGAKWQKEKDDEEKILTYKHGFNDCKEYIMKDATDVIVHIDAGGYPYIPQIELYDYDKDIPLAKEGDKYKVILIKED